MSPLCILFRITMWIIWITVRGPGGSVVQCQAGCLQVEFNPGKWQLLLVGRKALLSTLVELYGHNYLARADYLIFFFYLEHSSTSQIFSRFVSFS